MKSYVSVLFLGTALALAGCGQMAPQSTAANDSGSDGILTADQLRSQYGTSVPAGSYSYRGSEQSNDGEVKIYVPATSSDYSTPTKSNRGLRYGCLYAYKCYWYGCYYGYACGLYYR